MTTSEKAKALLGIVQAIADSIREVGSAPEGVLYAACMGNMRLDQFERIIDMLIRAKLIQRDSSHVLTWIGPKGGGQ